ncbi:MAG: HAD hydrolase-like protein [Pseudomonadota bacterium]
MDQNSKYLAVFDWNGTLLDDAKAVLAGQNASLALFGKDPTCIDVMRSREHIPLVHYFHHFGIDADTYLGRYQESAAAFGQAYKQACVDHQVGLRQGARALLDFFRDQGVVMTVLSNKVETSLRAEIEQYQLTDYFAAISGVESVEDYASGLSKTRRLGEMLDQFSIHPRHCLIVGDTQEECHAATHHGTIGVAILNGAGGQALLEKAHPTLIVNELMELPAQLVGHWPFLRNADTLARNT